MPSPFKRTLQNWIDRYYKLEGKHYYELKGDELKNFKMLVTKSNQPLYEEIKFAPKLYLWTRRGASRHCKMLGTDKKLKGVSPLSFDHLPILGMYFYPLK